MFNTIKISKRLINIFNNIGISLIVCGDVNYLDIDENTSTYITYLPMDKINEVKSINGDPWKNKRNKIKIGRFIKRMFIIDDNIVEAISNQYKSHYYFETGQLEKIFEIVDGEDIRYWYNQKNYTIGGGSLNSSCMRGESQQNRMDLYVDNPSVVKLLIMKSGDKLLSRALMWQTDKGVYIDRPYCRFDKDIHLYLKYAEKNNFLHYNKKPSEQCGQIMNITLQKRITVTPYMDTFKVNGKKKLINKL